jgi:hypothetical protein
MTWGWITFWIGGGAVVVFMAISRLIHAWRTHPDDGGDEAAGLVIFAESLRWLGNRWGMDATAAGLRKAGYKGKFLFWQWHETWRGMTVLPAIMDSRMLQCEAQKLADFIIAQWRQRPETPIYVMGYSCGGFVATRAVELLPEGVSVESLTLLAGAFSPWRDLNNAAGHVRGNIIVSSSYFDAIIIGLGTLVFGTADRKFTPSIGSLGYRGPACEKVIDLRWKPTMLHEGNWGDHFSAPATDYIRKWIAPKMGIGG